MQLRAGAVTRVNKTGLFQFICFALVNGGALALINNFAVERKPEPFKVIYDFSAAEEGQRSLSRSSILSKKLPFCDFALKYAIIAVKILPRCILPDGVGANLPVTI